MNRNIGYLTAAFCAAWCMCFTASLGADPYADCLGKGWSALGRKDYDRAIDAYGCAVRERLSSEDAWLGLLNARLMKKDYAGAGALGLELSNKFPENILIRKSAALAAYLNGNYAEAEKSYRSLVRDAGEDCEMRLGLGLSLRKLKRYEEALKECSRCGDSLKKDARFRDCVRDAETPPIRKISSWNFNPYLYASYVYYLRSWDRNYSAAVTTGVDIRHGSGAGFSVEGGYLASKYHYSPRMSLAGLNYGLPSIITQVLQQRSLMPTGAPRPPLIFDVTDRSVVNLLQSRLSYSNSVYREFQPGLGVSYTGADWYIGAHWVMLKAGTDAKTFYNVISLYGNYRYRFFTIGAGLDVGLYNGFRTVQAAPEIGFRFMKRFSLTLIPMLQYGFGTVSNSYTSLNLRASGAVRLAADFQNLSLGMTWYAGNRWYTVEEMGRLVLNSDEEYRWGGALKILLLPGRVVSPYISLRGDRGIKQYGMRHGFYSIGATAGLIFNF